MMLTTSLATFDFLTEQQAIVSFPPSPKKGISLSRILHSH
jgi:hypothetical protein